MINEIEIWRAVEDYKDGFYDGLYEISSFGRFKLLPRRLNCPNGSRLTKEKIVEGSNSWGYRTVIMKKDRIRLQIGVHILVARAFLPNPENKYSVNHIDTIRSNNRLENLEWATQQEQVQHALKMGRIVRAKGEEHTNCKLSEDKVKEMRKLHSTGVYTHRDLAKVYGISYGVVGQIVRLEKWKHIE